MTQFSLFTQPQAQTQAECTDLCVAGIDVGSRAVKLTLLNAQGHCVAQGISDQGVDQRRVARELLDCVCKGARLPQPAFCVATGYARNLIDFAHKTVTEITCHARGIRHCIPQAQTIIEVGGQDSKIICLDNEGRVRDFMMNDRCAAGTGRFLEIVAARLNMTLEDINKVVTDPRDKTCAVISSMCVVFAETEIIGLLASGVSAGAILRGVQKALAGRICAMTDFSNCAPAIVFTGGVALVPGMRQALEQLLHVAPVQPEHPQFTGSLGAALIALETFQNNQKQESSS